MAFYAPLKCFCHEKAAEPHQVNTTVPWLGELPGCIMAHMVFNSGRWDGALKNGIFQAVCLLLVRAGEQVREKKELNVLPAPLKQTFNN